MSKTLFAQRLARAFRRPQPEHPVLHLDVTDGVVIGSVREQLRGLYCLTEELENELQKLLADVAKKRAELYAARGALLAGLASDQGVDTANEMLLYSHIGVTEDWQLIGRGRRSGVRLGEELARDLDKTHEEIAALREKHKTS